MARMADLMRQAEWMGHKMGAETTGRIAGVKRRIRKCRTCGRKLALEGAAYGAAFNEECTRTRKVTLWFR